MTLTATEIATSVQAGTLDPVRVTEDALARIAAVDGVVGALRRVRTDEARAEAAELAARSDLAQLPLAGVPIVVKDVAEVAGEYASWGSAATSTRAAAVDHDVMHRLRAAGAVVVGISRVPELCVWPMSDGPDGTARNPWEASYTSGGSSGGSASAVAAGLVPLAHGTDGLGSVRLPAAMCGLVGIKPGNGTVPDPDAAGWFGMSVHGALGTTVTDTALLLSVLAQRPELAAVSRSETLRVAASTRVPLTRAPVPRPLRGAVDTAARLLAGQGHRVRADTPAYGAGHVAGLVTRWFAGPAEQAEGLDPRLLQPRTRAQVRIGRAVAEAGLIRDDTVSAWQRTAERFFAEHDVLATPMLATLPPKALRWHERSCLANAVPSLRMAGFAGLWNLAGYPALSVPMDRHPNGLPIGVQLVSSPGGESRLLGLAAELEQTNPWPRTAAQRVGAA